MKATELIAKLQAIVDEQGDMEVGFVDNGPFAENGGWVTDLEPAVFPDLVDGKPGGCIVL